MKINGLRYILAICWIIFSGEAPGQEQRVEKSIPTTAGVHSITTEELQEHIFFLASDSLQGRPAESTIYEIAADYCADEFRKAGLQPPYPDERGNSTFFQPVPFLKKTSEDKARLIIRTPFKEVIVTEGDKFKSNYCCISDLPISALPVVFVGYAIEEPAAGWNDFEGLDLTDKIALMLPGAPRKNGKPLLSDHLHQKYTTRGGNKYKYEAIARRKAAAVIILADKRLNQIWDRLFRLNFRIGLLYNGDAPSYAPRQQLGSLRGNRLYIKDDVAQTIFQGQPFHPVGTEESQSAQYQTFDIEGVTVQYQHGATGGPHVSYNVIAGIEGTDPVLKNETITVGAHLDHLPSNGGPVFNGADDNASGVAGVLEIAEAIVQNPPKRSVLFILYTAEEVGLYGSRHFLHHAPVPIKSIIANINLDMIGRSSPANQKTRAEYVEDADVIDPQFKELIISVNEQTVNWPLIFTSESESDHSIFLENNIPAASFFSGPHADYHKTTDDPEKIDYEKVQKISQLVYEIIMELGDKQPR